MKSGGIFPGDMKTAEARLRFYTSHFQADEADSSYYAYRRDSILQVSWEKQGKLAEKGDRNIAPVRRMKELVRERQDADG